MNVGDVVTLVPEYMTVTAVDGNLVTCEWIDDEGEHKHGSFSRDALRIEEDDDED